MALRVKIADSLRNRPRDNPIVTAIMLGFVGAIEQNLLGFSAAAPRRLSRNEPALISEGLVTYLRGDE